MKTIFYLSGLPRAGNTLFGSIMNQNPNIQVTGNSITAEMMWRITQLKETEWVSIFKDYCSLDCVIDNIIPNYYSKWAGNYIIDRAPWGTPDNLEMLKKHTKGKIKIIVLVRDINEILASFVRFSNKNKGNFISKTYNTVDEKCDYLMSNDGLIDREYGAIRHLLEPQNLKYSHFIEYNDLVNNTEDEIDKVYDFLNIEKFKHKFVNLEQFKANGIMYDDFTLGGDLHTIKTNRIKRSDYDIKDILPKHIIDRYSNMEIWRN